MDIYIDRMIFPVMTLGPGKRLAIWVSGCTRHCIGCANPELWERSAKQRVPVQTFINILLKTINVSEIDGITLSGGEPFEQAMALTEMLDMLRIDTDICIYSGYRLDEIQANADMSKLLKYADVLIDGPYCPDLNDGHLTLRGSSNQTIHYMNQKAKKRYTTYLQNGRFVQNFIYDNNIISVGIHNESGK